MAHPSRTLAITILLSSVLCIFPMAISGTTAGSPFRSTQGNGIRIDGDADLISTASLMGWSGNGSEADPYVISDLTIDSASGDCYYIGNTSLHLNIMNCTAINASYSGETFDEGSGITIYSSTHVRIIGFTAMMCNIGISMVRSNDIKVFYSNVSWNYENGMFIKESSGVDILDCEVTWNDFGIYLSSSQDVLVRGTLCKDNDDHAVLIEGSGLCEVSDCTFLGNDDGVHLSAASYRNLIANNTMSLCRESGIALSYCFDNVFRNNTMSGCGFYLPDEPISLSPQVIDRSNTVNGKDVLYLRNTAGNGTPIDLADIGQLIIAPLCSGLSLKGMSIDGGSQSVIIIDSEGIALSDLIISDPTFHAFRIHRGRNILARNVTVRSSLYGFEVTQSSGLVFLDDMGIEDCIHPLRVLNSDKVDMSDITLSGNEFGIEMERIDRCTIEGMDSSDCANPDLGIIGCGIIDIMDARIVSATTLIRSDRSFISLRDSHMIRNGPGPFIDDDGSNWDIHDNVFHSRTEGLSHQSTAMVLRTDGVSRFTNNSLLGFGLDPASDALDAAAGDTGNKVNGSPLLFLMDKDLNKTVISEDHGQIILKRVDDFTIRDQDIDNATCCIALVHCADGVVENCSLRGSQRGLGLYDTKATVIGSILKDNMVGIDVQKKSYQGSLQLSRNVLSGNRVGARIDGIDYSKIEGNLFSENVLTGLEMVKGVYTAVFHNLFKDNQGPAVSIKPTCTDSVICWNAFIGNNGSMERHTAQANDDGHNNSWASGKGNFWYGNAGKDGDGDLVLDDPLEIPGSAGSVDPLPMVRIPAGVLPPPCDIEIGTSEGSVVMNWGHKAGLMNATGFRLYIGGTPFREFDNGTRSFSLSFIELPQGELTMTTQCSFGEGEETQAMVLREDTEGPRISRNTDRKEFSSVRDSFTVEIFDPSDLPYVRCRFDDLEWIHIDEITEGSLFSMPLTTLAEGPHTVTIEARDRYWNPSNASFDILIDDSPPELSINLPGNSDLLNTTALPLTYSIREVVGTLERHMVRLDGTEMDLPPNGSVSLEGLKDGDHVLMLSAIDVAGNLNILTSDFTIDTRAPKVLAWSPEGSSLAEGVVIKVTLDEVPSNSSLWLDGGQLGSSVDGMVILGIPVDLDPGSFHNASVEGRDMAGNTFEFSWTFLTAFEEVPKVLVTGRLIDTYGRTLFGVEVWVSSALETTTGDNGTFEFLLEPGKHLMELKLDGHLTRTLVINVTAQGSNDLGDIVMERLGDIGEDPKGRPIWPYLLGALALAVIITILLLRRSSREGRQEE